jgi:hypothetical protein
MRSSRAIMADAGLLQDDEPLPGQRISELEHELQVVTRILFDLAWKMPVFSPESEEALNAANAALRVLG